METFFNPSDIPAAQLTNILNISCHNNVEDTDVTATLQETIQNMFIRNTRQSRIAILEHLLSHLIFDYQHLACG